MAAAPQPQPTTTTTSNNHSTNSNELAPAPPTTASPPPAAPQFNFSEASKYLVSRYTAAMEALASNQLPPSEKPELYKPPGPSSFTGGWGSGKHTSMANGQDFLTAILSKVEPLTTSTQNAHQQQQPQSQSTSTHQHHHHHHSK